MIGRLYSKVGEPITIEGYAQDYDYPITAVTFSGDEGESWTEYAIEKTDPLCNVNWSFEFTPQEVGLYKLLIKAVRADGKTSPEAAFVEVLSQSEEMLW